ncbi:hypothetical protein D3C76_752160 [compost metagenome]
MAVDQARDLRRHQCIGQHEGGRHRTGQAVTAGDLRQHGDDPDTGHRQRQPGQQAGQGEALGAFGLEQLAVGTEHARLSLSKGPWAVTLKVKYMQLV